MQQHSKVSLGFIEQSCFTLSTLLYMRWLNFLFIKITIATRKQFAVVAVRLLLLQRCALWIQVM